jgi:hypothetical protein
VRHWIDPTLTQATDYKYFSITYALRLLLLNHGHGGFQFHTQQGPASTTYKLLRILTYGIIYALAGFITAPNPDRALMIAMFTTK